MVAATIRERRGEQISMVHSIPGFAVKWVRENSVAPTGLNCFVPLDPGLAPWAIIFCPLCGLVLQVSNHSAQAKSVLTHTLKPYSFAPQFRRALPPAWDISILILRKQSCTDGACPCSPYQRKQRNYYGQRNRASRRCQQQHGGGFAGSGLVSDRKQNSKESAGAGHQQDGVTHDGRSQSHQNRGDHECQHRLNRQLQQRPTKNVQVNMGWDSRERTTPVTNSETPAMVSA